MTAVGAARPAAASVAAGVATGSDGTLVANRRRRRGRGSGHRGREDRPLCAQQDRHLQPAVRAAAGLRDRRRAQHRAHRGRRDDGRLDLRPPTSARSAARCWWSMRRRPGP
ncbi:MAG: hypothetical protein MZV70_10840 [Desulfobacterales bacterium]|nr:hypothetical protein [Desulfobacterales bacterium]